MAKKLKAIVTLQLNAGKATPAPPVGPALAQHGINIMGFVKEYNARTSTRIGEIVPAEITIFTDGSFKFELKSPPTTFLIMRAAGITKGSPRANLEKVGKITRKQVAEIAEAKRVDMNTQDLAAIMKQIEGTCLNMGVLVID
ncbi:MAG: 50S ribosomal protein L11 [Chloroflexota bacterium]|nr:50S ribosomal protein L11 [Chloroflexota bacterium]